jgi:hypothetical protein
VDPGEVRLGAVEVLLKGVNECGEKLLGLCNLQVYLTEKILPTSGCIFHWRYPGSAFATARPERLRALGSSRDSAVFAAISADWPIYWPCGRRGDCKNIGVWQGSKYKILEENEEDQSNIFKKSGLMQFNNAADTGAGSSII